MKPDEFLEWQRRTLDQKTTASPVPPELGEFYRTYDGSLVFVYLQPEPDKGGRAIVIGGGHQVQGLLGALVGENYQLRSDGTFAHQHLGPWTLMALRENVQLEAELGEDTSASLGELVKRLERRVNGAVLEGENDLARYFALLEHRAASLVAFGPCPATKAEVGALYWTLNGSLVLVLKDKGELAAFVLRGGHGLVTKRGEKTGESYQIDEEGQVLEVTDALALGMSLRSRVSKSVVQNVPCPLDGQGTQLQSLS
ncbi:MAG: hypothetical protein CO108_08950 [Deltaproteobacteria bacterium CG_4_9_14_3_um_filter_63_12]|nr:MAG: hypothetical protein CO108_08950 [Deltaproteobacteria bacterium CG_4_9_14_3_um_filter_63_12]